jgi:long-chain acyl-CoA synthetase
VLLYGLKMGFFNGDVQKLTEDMQILKPTIFSTVPRLLNRVYDKLVEKLKGGSGIQQMLVNRAISSKLYYL